MANLYCNKFIGIAIRMEETLQISYKILCINEESFSNFTDLFDTDEFLVCNLDKIVQFKFYMWQ